MTVPPAVPQSGFAAAGGAPSDARAILRGVRKNFTAGGVVAIDRNTIATHELIPLLAGKRIVITQLVLSAHGAQVVRFLSNGVNKTGRLKFADAGGMVCLGDGSTLILAGDVGQNFQMSLTAAIETGGWLVYGYDEG